LHTVLCLQTDKTVLYRVHWTLFCGQ
jgi:hypothetical protein